MLLPLPQPTPVSLLCLESSHLLSGIWLDDVRYMKGGVVAGGLLPEGMQQGVYSAALNSRIP